MAAKCKICGAPIDDGTICAGFELPNGTFICDTIDCTEFAIGVVEAARSVVAQFTDVTKWPTQGIRIAIEKLREALAE